LWEPIVRVPLVVYVPGADARHVAEKRSAIDLVPTFLDLMRVPLPPSSEISGRSMIRDLFPEEGEPFEERDVYMDMPPGPTLPLRRAFIHGVTPGLKLMHHGGAYFTLIDLVNDPDEMGDLSWDVAQSGPMNEAYDRFRARLHDIWVPPDAPPPDAGDPFADASSDDVDASAGPPDADALDAAFAPDDGAPQPIVDATTSGAVGRDATVK
jgi:arylsulfatase A-like enzyme